MVEVKKHQWKYVITLKNGEKIFSDQVIGDTSDNTGTVVIVKTKTTGQEYARLTVAVANIDQFEQKTM